MDSAQLNVNTMSTMVGLFAAMSVAVERVVELIKGALPVLANPRKTREGVRRAPLEGLAVVAGAVIASQMQSQFTQAGVTFAWKGDLLPGPAAQPRGIMPSTLSMRSSTAKRRSPSSARGPRPGLRSDPGSCRVLARRA
jgi:hypothetical protein